MRLFVKNIASLITKYIDEVKKVCQAVVDPGGMWQLWQEAEGEGAGGSPISHWGLYKDQLLLVARAK